MANICCEKIEECFQSITWSHLAEIVIARTTETQRARAKSVSIIMMYDRLVARQQGTALVRIRVDECAQPTIGSDGNDNAYLFTCGRMTAETMSRKSKRCIYK